MLGFGRLRNLECSLPSQNKSINKYINKIKKKEQLGLQLEDFKELTQHTPENLWLLCVVTASYGVAVTSSHQVLVVSTGNLISITKLTYYGIVI